MTGLFESLSSLMISFRIVHKKSKKKKKSKAQIFVLVVIILDFSSEHSDEIKFKIIELKNN